jgi:hypothetical protein
VYTALVALPIFYTFTSPNSCDYNACIPVASVLKLGEEMMFETGIAFEPSKSAISLISVGRSRIFINFLTLCTSYNQGASNAHNFMANREELSEENVF